MAFDRAAADDPGLVGRTIAGGLRVTERSGSTPQGPLYQAEYQDGRPVLLLVLPSRAPGQESPEARSFRLATRIRHPNVAAVRAVGELEDGSVYVVLEQLVGEPLLHLLSEGSALPLGEALDLALQAAAGLEAVHEAGFVHGSLSPSAIVVTRAPYGNAQLKLVGFSTDPDRRLVSRLEAGSEPYAAPERLGGKTPDERSDVFSLGAVLHHLLSGGPPDRSRVARKVPRIARPVLEKALASSPAARFQSMWDFREALERLAAAAVAPRRAVVSRALLLRVVASGLVLAAGGLLVVPVWRSMETNWSRTASIPADTEPAVVAPQASQGGRAATPAPSGSAAPTASGARGTPPRPPSEPGRVAGGASTRSDRAAGAATQQEEPAESPEALGYVGETTSAESPDVAERMPPPPPPRARPTPPIAPPADPPRPRAVLEQNPGLRHAIGDVTRIGLAENVAEVRPGLLVVQLAAGGMGVPSATYNLQRLYLAYSAATRQADSVAIELRRGREVYGRFTREGLRHPRSGADLN